MQDIGNEVIARVAISAIICALGIFGNIVAVFVILVLKEYQKSITHWYIFHLALADSLFLLTIPFKISEDLNQEWIYPEWMCKIKETIVFLNYYASIIFLMIMSLDRYIAVCHPFSNMLQKLRKRRSALIIVIITWTLSLLLCIPVILYSFKIGTEPNCVCSYKFPRKNYIAKICDEIGFEPSSSQSLKDCKQFLFTGFEELLLEERYCSPFVLYSPSENDKSGVDWNKTEENIAENSMKNSMPSDSVHEACHYYNHPVGWITYIAFNFSVMFLLPLLVMLLCYGLIVRRFTITRMRTISTSSIISSQSDVKKRKGSSRSEKDRKRITKLCFVLVSCFVVCWLPFHASHLAKISGIPNQTPEFCQELVAVVTIFGYLNSALNPYLYSFVGTNFLKRWKSLKKPINFDQVAENAAWKQGDSSGSSRHYQFTGIKNRVDFHKNQADQSGFAVELALKGNENQSETTSNNEKQIRSATGRLQTSFTKRQQPSTSSGGVFVSGRQTQRKNENRAQNSNLQGTMLTRIQRSKSIDRASFETMQSQNEGAHVMTTHMCEVQEILCINTA